MSPRGSRLHRGATRKSGSHANRSRTARTKAHWSTTSLQEKKISSRSPNSRRPRREQRISTLATPTCVQACVTESTAANPARAPARAEAHERAQRGRCTLVPNSFSKHSISRLLLKPEPHPARTTVELHHMLKDLVRRKL